MSELQEALRLADSRYEARAITQLDVLKARVALTESRTNRLEANYRHHRRGESTSGPRRRTPGIGGVRGFVSVEEYISSATIRL